MRLPLRAARQLLEALGERDALEPFALVRGKPLALTPEDVALFLRSGLPLPPLPTSTAAAQALIRRVREARLLDAEERADV